MLNIVLAETSYIIRKGILELLSDFHEIGKITESTSSIDLEQLIDTTSPDIIIANIYFDHVLRSNLSTESEDQPIVLYLYHSPLPQGESPTHLSIFEDKATLIEKFEQAINSCRGKIKDDLSLELSPREKLVLKQVALGQTNKEIADTLFISTHTVISHRKNITKKLGIKTVSGLTVYAILNKLIGIDDVS